MKLEIEVSHKLYELLTAIAEDDEIPVECVVTQILARSLKRGVNRNKPDTDTTRLIKAFIDTLPPFVPNVLIAERLGWPCDRKHTRRIGAAMRKIGYSYKQFRVAEGRERMWVKDR